MTIKIIRKAAKIDPSVAPLVPKIAESFAIVAKDPAAKEEFSAHTESDAEEANCIDPSITTYLIQAIHVLSLSAPVYPTKVNKLMVPHSN
jgi:hypothetical protein